MAKVLKALTQFCHLLKATLTGELNDYLDSIKTLRSMLEDQHDDTETIVYAFGDAGIADRESFSREFYIKRPFWDQVEFQSFAERVNKELDEGQFVMREQNTVGYGHYVRLTAPSHQALTVLSALYAGTLFFGLREVPQSLQGHVDMPFLRDPSVLQKYLDTIKGFTGGELTLADLKEQLNEHFDEDEIPLQT